VEYQEKNIYVDTDAKLGDDVFHTIESAIEAAQPGNKIEIASNIYEEELVITQPELILEPKDLNGEVTLEQSIRPCIIIDVGHENTCTVNNLRMLLKGPNKDADIHSF
jgi:hypothetical protein